MVRNIALALPSGFAKGLFLYKFKIRCRYIVYGFLAFWLSCWLWPLICAKKHFWKTLTVVVNLHLNSTLELLLKSRDESLIESMWMLSVKLKYFLSIVLGTPFWGRIYPYTVIGSLAWKREGRRRVEGEVGGPKLVGLIRELVSPQILSFPFLWIFNQLMLRILLSIPQSNYMVRFLEQLSWQFLPFVLTLTHCLNTQDHIIMFMMLDWDTWIDLPSPCTFIELCDISFGSH